MKLVVQVRLLPTPEQVAALKATLRACNDAANFASVTAFTAGDRREYALRKHTYREVKARGLGAQAAQQVIKKVADAYTTLKANARAGNLGPQGCARRIRAESKPIAFRADAAQPFDDRCLSWDHTAHTVSIWTTTGRLKKVAFTGSLDQLKMLALYRKGESDLVCRDGMWFLYATCEIPDVPVTEPDGFIGVDLGIANIATTSDGTRHCGKGLNAVRHRNRELRSWSFHQLGSFIAYKAARHGVAVIHVDSAYTSQACSACGHVDKRNRPDQNTFSCTSCGFAEHADVNAARNIASRGVAGWAVSHAADDAA
ncbi:RNA-guided endonuclease InsQ/TnpB family protein [Microtetraspora malaysiensis]|uniref:RNA-guided endonuclease InsQ/TnpB family protein n=1 Tax=Microtetraspora malaysiensis TaxID=161358 RepID=UPI000834CCFF|nr:zinc ribbon domain-containing protein [Microtetraspora malaysiensis]